MQFSVFTKPSEIVQKIKLKKYHSQCRFSFKKLCYSINAIKYIFLDALKNSVCTFPWTTTDLSLNGIFVDHRNKAIILRSTYTLTQCSAQLYFRPGSLPVISNLHFRLHFSNDVIQQSNSKSMWQSVSTRVEECHCIFIQHSDFIVTCGSGSTSKSKWMTQSSTVSSKRSASHWNDTARTVKEDDYTF